MYDELKKLAEAATPGPWQAYDTHGRRCVESMQKEAYVVQERPSKQWLKDSEFIAAANPSAVLVLIAENERLKREEKNDKIAYKAVIERQEELRAEIECQSLQFKEWQASHHSNYCKAADERDQLKAENEVARMRIKELDLLFGRYILAMRAAVIEEEHGMGATGGMIWIYNSLVGPGELPPESETLAQAYFDREVVAIDDGMQEVLAFHDARRKAKEAAK